MFTGRLMLQQGVNILYFLIFIYFRHTCNQGIDSIRRRHSDVFLDCEHDRSLAPIEKTATVYRKTSYPPLREPCKYYVLLDFALYPMVAFIRARES